MSQLHFLLCRTREGKLKTFNIRMSPPTVCLGGWGVWFIGKEDDGRKDKKD